MDRFFIFAKPKLIDVTPYKIVVMNPLLSAVQNKNIMVKGKSFYAQIDSKFASRHFHKICLLDPQNRNQILGGLSFIGIGLVAVTLGAIKIFRGAYF